MAFIQVSRYERLDAAILQGALTRPWKEIADEHHVSKATFYRRSRLLGVQWPRKYPADYYDVPRSQRRARIKKDRYHTDETYRAKAIDYSVKWAQNNRQRYLLNSVRCRAKRLNLPFNLEAADIIIPTVCPVLGIPLVVGSNKLKNNSPSIDRIKPALGYVKDNIQVVSWRANNLKRDATVDELEKVLVWMRGQS